MNTNKFFLYLFLIISYSNCILFSDDNFEDIQFMTPTKFSVNKDKIIYFKYKLDEQKKSIGLKFLHANIYTVNVTIYKSYEGEKQISISYLLGQNQFKEIDVSDFDDYVYIVIEEISKNYYYDNYLTIYDSSKKIKLEHNKVISINNFLSTNKYELYYPSNNSNIVISYNTQNFEKNKRKISAEYEGEQIISNYEEGTLRQFFNLSGNDTLIVTIENIIEDNSENHEFSIIIHEVNQSEYNFNQIKQNQTEVINYIYYNDSQIYYFYTDISNIKNSNTFNFKLNYQYFNKKNITIRTNLINLDDEITIENLTNNTPTTNNLPCSYDDESDEYYRIYFYKNDTLNKNYLYLLVSIEINDDNYYYGNKFLEVSIGDEEKILDYSNKFQNFKISSLNYIPYYARVLLDSNKKYLLYFPDEFKFVTTFIKGDILNEDKSINTNFLTSDNEIIILSDLKELTLKLFGPKKIVNFSIEEISSNFEYKENERDNNYIYKLEMKKDEMRYILGTYSYEDYAYGSLKVNYYATIDKGGFELYYKNNIREEESSLFPSDSKYKQNFDEIFSLDTNIDLFKVVCNEDGIISIRPQYKEFNVTTVILKENSFNKITMSEYSEVIQLSAPIKRNNNILYFSILFLNPENSTVSLKESEVNLSISPDTAGVFEGKTIKANQVFTASIDLAKYKLDELAIHLNSNQYDSVLEIVEIIPDYYTTYKEIKQGENKDITSYNVLLPISSDKEKLYINLENLNGKTISYIIIKTAINNTNYLLTSDKYENNTKIEIKQSIENIALNNSFYNQTDNIKPYIYFLLSVLNQEKDLKYNIKIDFNNDKEDKTDQKGDDDDTTKIIIIVVIIVAVILILLGIILFNHIMKKKRTSSEIEKITTELIIT